MRNPTLALLTLACTLAACGDDPGPVDSGLPAEKTGKELTADEEKTLCEANIKNLAAQNTEAELKNSDCVTDGLFFAAAGENTPASCESFAQMCRDGAGEEAGDEGGEQMCVLGFDPSACDATIVDIEACLTEKNVAAGEAIRDASCDAAGKTPSEPVVGPMCAKIKSTCVGIA